VDAFAGSPPLGPIPVADLPPSGKFGRTVTVPLPRGLSALAVLTVDGGMTALTITGVQTGRVYFDDWTSFALVAGSTTAYASPFLLLSPRDRAITIAWTGDNEEQSVVGYVLPPG